MAGGRALEPQVVIDLLERHQGQFPFKQLVDELKIQGLDDANSRELIWQTLALGLIEFTPDRSVLRMRPDDEGKVA